MTRVIHTGDTHIGYRQYHSPERRRDFLEAFRRVVEDATDGDVDAVVHAGDLFNDRRPNLQDLLGTISVLEALRAAEVPFLAIVGNHEDARRGQWLDLFERLGLATHLDETGTVVGDTAFYGLDYVPKSKRDTLDYHFEPPDVDTTALVAHGLFSPFPHGDWDLETVLDAATVDFDAVLLGDDHTPETIEIKDTWATYCGSTERSSASEREPRGYNIVEFEDDAVSITRRSIDTREFVFIDVELDAGEGAGYIRERIREEDVEDAVVIVTIEGDGESVTPADIESFGQDQGALITRVNDRREFDEESAVEVSFADPDDAVRDRIREMGLSEAARTVDEIVRESDIARSNVRSRVKEGIQEMLEAEDAFEPADQGTEPESTDERATEEPAVEHRSMGPEEGSERSESAAENETASGDAPAGEGTGSEDAAGEDTDDAVASEDDSDEETKSATPRETTMEDFL